MLRLYRIEHEGHPRYAAEREGRWRLVEGDIFGSFREGAAIAPDRAPILAPVRPSKVVCVGLNYRDHAAEQNKPLPAEPLLFIKPSTSVIGQGDPIQSPQWAGRVDHEAELGVVIGKPTFNVKANRAAGHILGLTCVNDVTARDLQREHLQWFKGKSLDDTCPLGPWIVTADEIGDAQNLNITFRLDGVQKQAANTASMIFPIPRLIAELSKGMTLEPGDVIATGTPDGVGFARTPPEFLQTGQVMEVEIENIGILRNTVRIS
jgi:2-keto-4-pentenoate hydratase/2-oxohepta-3-ene-1,7-dioic acid hydratase in catechol pathway